MSTRGGSPVTGPGHFSLIGSHSEWSRIRLVRRRDRSREQVRVTDHAAPPGTGGPSLDRSGVDWRVLNNRAIAAEGSAPERAAAVERTSQDLAYVREIGRDRPWIAEGELEAELSAELRVLREAISAEGNGAAPGAPSVQ